MSTKIETHHLRKEILAEIHARPYAPITTPRTVLQQAFLCKPSTSAQEDLDIFSKWCQTHNLKIPTSSSRHHTVSLNGVGLIWERHTEFLTLTWDCMRTNTSHEKLWALAEQHINDLKSEGHLLVSATHINLVKANNAGKEPDLTQYDTNSICMSSVKNDRALVLVDFRQDKFGATKYTVQNNNLNAKNCGILVRRLLEIETYRVMSLYGFERLKTVLPKIASIEQQLVHLTSQMNGKNDLDTTRRTLNEITDISSDLANLSATSQYRFSATRAYYSLVNARLTRLNEQGISNYSKIEEFLAKRLAPAMRTCENIEKRIQKAGDKLDRSMGLLRTKIDIQMQVQNHKVLDTMNKRALMQYRLQTTVEGLSIAAVSYYMVGLVSYMIKGLGIDDLISPEKLTAIFVPITILTVWLIVKRIRAKHDKAPP